MLSCVNDLVDRVAVGVIGALEKLTGQIGEQSDDGARHQHVHEFQLILLACADDDSDAGDKEERTAPKIVVHLELVHDMAAHKAAFD